jgi:hypothetical protein
MIIIAMLWWGLCDTAFALQYDRKVVSEGYQTWRVRQSCGEPINIENIQQVVLRTYYDPYRHTYVETFIYI